MHPDNAPQVSVVIPVYNEEPGLPRLMERLRPVMDSLGMTYEIILVDDGSRDNSLAVLKKYATEPGIKVVELTKNYGQHAAVFFRLLDFQGEYRHHHGCRSAESSPKRSPNW